ncbi:MAG TPA: hypothetical protein VFN43_00225 [Humibacillus sp.]|nr:hypothetical protein [Humibacillus sp.]
MSTLAIPSPDFPRPPSVTLEVGDGWEPVHTPGTKLHATLFHVAWAGDTAYRVRPCAAHAPMTREQDA